MASAVHTRELLHTDLFTHSTAADAQLRAQQLAIRVGLQTSAEIDAGTLTLTFSGQPMDVAEFMVRTRAENIELERAEADEDWQRRILAANASPATRVCDPRAPQER